MSFRKLLLATTMLFTTYTAASATDVLTQHNDAARTGYNPAETILTASNVKAGTFGLLHSVALDDQVDAQPLVLSSFTIGGASHTVAYVVTENNTVYAIDTSTGTILLQRNLGTPVPESVFGNCNNNAPHVGINSTPVIDRAAGKLYVVTNTLSGTNAVYKLHALSLTTLADISTATVTATHQISGGTYTFNPSKNRQRAALLEANGTIYVAFTSYCDLHSNVIRGLVLGYKASSLSPLAANYLVNTQAQSANAFLSTIWMSGNGLAASSSGSIFLVTGNSQNGTYSTTANLEESVVNLSSDLTKVLDFFTPSNVNTMDDQDFNSGGVMLIPPQTGTSTLLATALGKDGRLFLLDQRNLGKFGTSNHVLQTVSAGACWCSESYYKGPTGQGRVVTSTGSRVTIWRIVTSPLSLTKYATLPPISTGQDPGFFTAVSANGNTSNTIIIWAVSRPINSSPASVTLSAFNVANSALLYSANAGTWPNVTGNANIMPTVANGQVLVASFKQLAIFGLTTGAAPAVAPLVAAFTPAAPILGAPNQVSGWIDGINGNQLTIRKRDGTHVTIDDTLAVAADQVTPLSMELAITAIGTTDANGTLQAQTIVRAKNNVALFPPDQ